MELRGGPESLNRFFLSIMMRANPLSKCAPSLQDRTGGETQAVASQPMTGQRSKAMKAKHDRLPRMTDDPGTTLFRLDDFLKYSGWVETGGEAKLRIQGGEVKVNGQVEIRRRRQLCAGDVVEFMGERLVVREEPL